MPNWVTNKVVITGKAERITEIMKFVKGDRDFDFHKIIPMPGELENTSSPCPKNPDLIAKYGSDNWYDWSCKNWGTKWNSSESSVPRINLKGTRITYLFATAWSTPAPVLQKVAETFPDVKIKVWYADEDRGSNVGVYGFANGEIILDESYDGLPKGRRLAQRLG